MRNKEELAEEFTNRDNLSWENDYAKEAYLTGFDSAIEKVKEYLFNTEEHQDKDGKFYISEDYLKQTIKFLNDQ